MPLTNILYNSESDVKDNVLWALGQINAPQAVEPLISTLQNNNLVLQWRTILSLGKLGSEQGVQPLFNLLLDHQHLVIKESASKAITKIGVPAIAYLAKASKSNNSENELQARVLLEHIYNSVQIVVFGTPPPSERRDILINPDVSELEIPLANLKNILIFSETYDFHKVEKFLTYAVNYISTKSLKKRICVSIYGSKDNIHPNLYNGFINRSYAFLSNSLISGDDNLRKPEWLITVDVAGSMSCSNMSRGIGR